MVIQITKSGLSLKKKRIYFCLKLSLRKAERDRPSCRELLEHDFVKKKQNEKYFTALVCLVIENIQNY
jgi:hypothetical protein